MKGGSKQVQFFSMAGHVPEVKPELDFCRKKEYLSVRV
jgi:hypothetical protein